MGGAVKCKYCAKDSSTEVCPKCTQIQFEASVARHDDALRSIKMSGPTPDLVHSMADTGGYDFVVRRGEPVADIVPLPDGTVAWAWVDPDGTRRVCVFASADDERACRSFVEHVKP